MEDAEKTLDEPQNRGGQSDNACEEAEEDAAEENEQLGRRANTRLNGVDTPHAVIEDAKTLQMAGDENGTRDKHCRADEAHSADHSG